MGSLIAAYSVAWTLLMLYVLTLASRQRSLRRSLETIQRQIAESAARSAAGHGR